jgi:hypothetical protein
MSALHLRNVAFRGNCSKWGRFGPSYSYLVGSQSQDFKGPPLLYKVKFWMETHLILDLCSLIRSVLGLRLQSQQGWTDSTADRRQSVPAPPCWLGMLQRRTGMASERVERQGWRHTTTGQTQTRRQGLMKKWATAQRPACDTAAAGWDAAQGGCLTG